MPYPAEPRWRSAASGATSPMGRTLVGDHGQTTRGARYTVEEPDRAADRRAARRSAGAARGLKREFTEVPDSLPPVVAETAREVTAGSANNYERAVKLQDWFAVDGGFTYDTQVQVGSGSRRSPAS